MLRLCQCPFFRPASFEASENPAQWHSEFVGPSLHRLRPAVERKEPIDPRIASLFLECCPPAVVGFIVAIYVDAVYRVIRRWLRPHIGQEVLERVAPPVANRDTASAVMFPSDCIRIRAAVLESLPGAILRGVRPVVPQFQFSDALSFQASATLGQAAGESGSGDDNLCAAVANARPVYSRPPVREADNSEPRESLAREIFESGSVAGTLADSHDVTFREKVACGQSRQAFPRLFRLASFYSVSY